MEKRQHPRLYKCLPMEYQVGQPDAAEVREGQGVVKDISLGGIYFKCKDPLPFATGQTLEFTINTTPVPRKPGPSERSTFKGKGQVVRIEPPEKNSPYFGVAVQFLQPIDLAKVVQKSSSRSTPA